jgi:hypothetical protein
MSPKRERRGGQSTKLDARNVLKFKDILYNIFYTYLLYVLLFRDFSALIPKFTCLTVLTIEFVSLSILTTDLVCLSLNTNLFV